MRKRKKWAFFCVFNTNSTQKQLCAICPRHEKTLKPLRLQGFSWWRLAGSNRWPLDCQNFTFSGMCIMHSFFGKFGSKIPPKTGNIFLYFLDSIYCFNRNDCIQYFPLYKRLNQMPLCERGFLRNHSNSGRFGNFTSSEPVISSCRMHESKLWFQTLPCRDKSCDFVTAGVRRKLWFPYEWCLDKICDSVM